MSCDQALAECYDLLDLIRREDSTHALRVELGEWGFDEVLLLDVPGLQDEGSKRLEKPDLERGQRRVLRNVRVERVSDRLGP